jgi:hypothetical protein
VTAGDDGRGMLIAGDTRDPACAAAVDRALSDGETSARSGFRFAQRDQDAS